MFKNRFIIDTIRLSGVIILLLVNLFAKGQDRLPACGNYAQFYSADSINVITFGASTVEGVPAPFNFQQPLKSFIENCYSNKAVNVYNYGVAGETTAKGLLRFDAAIANKTGFVMILMGVNDAIQLANGRGGSVAATADNVRKMIEKAKKANLHVILGTLQSFLDPGGRSPQAVQARKVNYFINQINIKYRGLATKFGLKVADINTVVKHRSLYADDVHPNRRGYYVMALVWFDALNQEIVENHLTAAVVQNYPNPANTFTKLGFTLSSASAVKVSLYNLNGQHLGVVFNDYRNAGYHVEEISTAKYPSGIYVLYYEFLNQRFSRKMVIVH